MREDGSVRLVDYDLDGYWITDHDRDVDSYHTADRDSGNYCTPNRDSTADCDRDSTATASATATAASRSARNRTRLRNRDSNRTSALPSLGWRMNAPASLARVSRARRFRGAISRNAGHPTSATRTGNPDRTRSADDRHRAGPERQRVVCSQVGSAAVGEARGLLRRPGCRPAMRNRVRISSDVMGHSVRAGLKGPVSRLAPDDVSTGLRAGGLARQPEGSAKRVAGHRETGGFHRSSFTTDPTEFPYPTHSTEYPPPTESTQSTETSTP